ncbi:hypothetical protein IPF86_04315 [Candidatus Nomurabacteria bacterium]|jgi:hypothetical protein|nr:MAG: hypothetical protein IPF86_04315 [Candidatus Nomurabacteria bacterium]
MATKTKRKQVRKILDPRQELVKKVVLLLETIKLICKPGNRRGINIKKKWHYSRNKITKKAKKLILEFNELQNARKALDLLAKNGLNPRGQSTSKKVTISFSRGLGVLQEKKIDKRNTSSTKPPQVNRYKKIDELFANLQKEIENLKIRADDSQIIKVKKTDQAQVIINSLVKGETLEIIE